MHKKKRLNKQFVFSVNKRGDCVLPTLVSCAYVHTYTVHIVALHMSRSLYTLRASNISLIRTFYISRVGWEGLIKFEAFVFLALTLPPPYSRVLWKTRYPSASMPIQIMNGHQFGNLGFLGQILPSHLRESILSARRTPLSEVQQEKGELTII